MSDEEPDEPARPEIDPSLLREAGEGAAAAAAEKAPQESAPPAAAAPVAAPTADDPELPGVSLESRIEALLFVATEPLPLRRLKELLLTDDGRLVREALDRLAADYAAAGRAIRVDEVAGGFQLKTREELAPLVARVGRKPETEKLSAAALETLAIVAYRQPVLRADVEKIRGVASGEVLRALLERGLVRVAGHAEVAGRPIYYGTTTRFLEVFGLRDLQDLPRDADALRPAGG